MYYYNIELLKVCGISEQRNDAGVIYTHFYCGKRFVHTINLHYDILYNSNINLNEYIENIFKYIMRLNEIDNYYGQGYYISIKEELSKKRYYYIECDLIGDIIIKRIA